MALYEDVEARAASTTAVTSFVLATARRTQSLPAGASTATMSSFSTATPSVLPIGELPLPPQITPGLCVAGVLLILSGMIYCFIGIRRKWIQISISSAYLVALAITVLIVYIMDLPVSLATQGAYVAAVVLPAILFGALACIFQDITEGFGCAVGGFALSMFLLILRPGGLLTTTTEKSIFIGCFTMVIFMLSLSHYTRTYTLIASSSIGGATAVILGIDCFSLAGLKEFWVYIWGMSVRGLTLRAILICE